MAEADTILQLGIAAAREGNREEARNLFSLLTRQEPDNVQAWLWLAGVAEGPDERRAALERVVELDPTNEMAIKGLQAMGVTPQTAKAEAPAATPPPSEPAPPPRQDLSEEEMYAAELDAAFEDYDTVPKEAPPPRNDPTPIRSGDYDDDQAGVTGTTARERIENRRNNRGGLSPLLLGLIALILICIIGIFFFNRGSGDDPVAVGDITATVEENGGAVAPTDEMATAEAGGIGEGTPSAESTPPEGEGTPDTEGIPPEGEGTPPEGEGTSPEGEGNQPQAPTIPADIAGATPEIVPIATILESNGWSYAFPGNCFGGCGALIGPQVGGFTAQGTYMVVILQVANSTGTPQPIPADFFVLKDAQGQVRDPLPDVSGAYVIPGINADLSMQSPVPANGVLTSVAFIFDVPSGATDLVVFARSNTNQGWVVLNAVP